MKILFENVLENYSGIAATNQSLNFPVKNLVDFALHKRFQSSESSSVITVDFDSDQCFNCFFYGYHNLTSLNIVFKDWGGNTVKVLDIPETEDIGVKHFDQIIGIRKIEVAINKVTVLIGSNGVDETKFDTADYIPISNTAGIYPAYENLLRFNGIQINIPSMNASEGYFIMNVPALSSSAGFRLSSVYQEDGKDYTIYFESSVGLLQLRAIDAVAPSDLIFEIDNPALKEIINYNIFNEDGIVYQFIPYEADKDKDILIKYTIVPKGYPNIQEWAGSQLNATFSGDENSWTWQFSKYLNQDTPTNAMMEFRNASNQLRFQVVRWQEDRYIIRVFTDVLGSVFTTISPPVGTDKGTFTISINNFNVSVYHNKSLLEIVIVDWVDRPTKVTVNDVDNLGYDINSFFTSTEESTGYPQDTLFESDGLKPFLGGLGAGCCYEMPNFLSVYERPNPDNSISSESPGGQSQQNFVKPFRAYNFSFNTYADIAKAVYNEYIKAGVGKPLYIDIFEDAHDVEAPVYSKILAPIGPVQGKISNTYSLSIKEVR
jgi:hypothetical protein